MTAEIAILNNSGIALAADSAVTIGSQKVYNSANKLFTLSKYQPVGIMVYDSADLMDIPWEIIVKEFRSELGQDSYPTIKEYADAFWDFISENTRLIPQANRDNYVAKQIFNYLDMIYNELEKKVEIELNEKEEITGERSLSFLQDVIQRHVSIIFNADFSDNACEDDAKALLSEHSDVFEELANRQLGRLFIELELEEKEELKNLVFNVFVRDRFILSSSGVVIAGYGTEEMFPKISSHTVEGVFGRKVRKLFDKVRSNVQHDVFSTFIVPFAQDEMVWTFITGIDPDIVEFSERKLKEVFVKYSDYIGKDKYPLSDEQLKEIKLDLWKGGSELFDEFKKSLSDYQRESNTQPILDMVGVLPKDELAAMAESLVNLTVFKRKISKSVETVGGPIDVAIISKGDGFIWVKRKHYFKPELNQHFFANYYNNG